MLIKRIITAALLLPLFVAALFYLPNRYWAVLLLAVLLLAAWEWCALAGFEPVTRWIFAGTVLASCIGLLLAARPSTGAAAWVEYTAYWIAAAFWVLVVPVWIGGKWRLRNPAVLGVAGWVVLVPTWLALVQLQRTPGELLMLMGIVWVADIAAYFVGWRIGRRKLAPEVSPGKTWEGVLGAGVAVALYYVLLRIILGPDEVTFLRPAGFMLFLGITLVSIEGDLFESWIKRQAGAKDSGSLLPGHGGVLDRIDALTSSMPVMALALLYIK
ncbi:MAG: phosphatidate cytidylyltransferase [Betaproteobacteria bacterium]|nr:phosphatidate cytidylyltransferase [Betaproteobacteria bacterium]